GAGARDTGWLMAVKPGADTVSRYTPAAILRNPYCPASSVGASAAAGRLESASLTVAPVTALLWGSVTLPVTAVWAKAIPGTLADIQSTANNRDVEPARIIRIEPPAPEPGRDPSTGSTIF